ncbi:MAG: ATP-binding protein [Candidatus Eisenbacteria bacterium]|uniref:ATP-binding protein n=1 Tax=Eiseniibacteriota bacterium TaxID=2212470 RepID=A0A948RYH7_UNCEI|nr:ATP-binding protein [Candidatus Eisenbacteria bacterium]MBU1950320.1 ATP-binding protein [Candidatus Eisenbacteria bacterium]MBU2693180.1 ATP-binding protein [Candidatus Eisenbacteria bacterium]
MKRRSLAPAIGELAFSDHKIAFVSGPRQCGKTTLAKMMLRERKTGVYHNWDELKFRHLWTQDPSSIIPISRGKDVPLIVLDELHKNRRWKRDLKGVFDTLTKPCDLLVTGSARLNIYMKGSDSLLGRHLSFRLHPFSLREMESSVVLNPDEALNRIFVHGLRRNQRRQDNLAALMNFGPFPEPLLNQDKRKARIWHRNHEQLIVREDLRDLSRLPELGRIEMMIALLPARIGSLFSMASIGRDLEASIPTVKRWIGYLKALYYLFEVKPYHKKIPRALRREGKVYLWDYSAIPNEAARFENLVACHLLKACHFWTDTGEGTFELFYLRNKEKQEIDFLIVRDGVPWLPVEVKLSETMLSPSWRKFAGLLPCKRCIQVVRQPSWNIHDYQGTEILVVGASEALAHLV